MIPIRAEVGEPMYEYFRHQNLSTFNVSTALVEAKDWLKKVQRIFEYMKLEAHEKLACPVNQLEIEALF